MQDILSNPDIVDFNETIGTQSKKAICNSSRISYGYCDTICSGAASLPSQFVDMSVSPAQPFDWIKKQAKSPELREVINLIKKPSFTQGRLRSVIQVSLRPS